MSENAFVVVFPSVFAKSKQSNLISNVRKVLRIQGQRFGRILRDEELVIIEANDPVFASSAVNLLFGISRVCIARRVENKYDTVVSSIAKIGASLLLQGEQFHVKVEGCAPGYIPKDVEIAATSALIESSHKSGCRPGTEEKHDKQIYCYLTKKNAYIAIFSDGGHGGVPYNWQNQKIVCCIYDELSAVSCLEAIKQGFDVRIIVCYNDSNLLDIVRMLNRILPRTVSSQVDIEFFTIPKGQGAKSVLHRAKIATWVLCSVAMEQEISRVGLALSPLVYPVWFIDENADIILKSKLTPWPVLAGLDEQIIRTAKEIGLGKYLHKIEKLGAYKFSKEKSDVSRIVKESLGTRQKITVNVGPNNVHEILDMLKH